MEFLFGKKKTPAEMLKENQRALKKSMRELDREKTQLERQEKKLVTDMKKAAKEGQMESVKIMAKDIVRTRKNKQKMMMMKCQIQAVSLKIQTLKSVDTMANAMKGVTRAMGRMNKTMNIPALQKMMMEFEKQNDIMDMKQEVMDDAIDDVMGDADEDADTELEVSKVMDELGLSVSSELVDAHDSNLAEKESGTTDLEARFANLKRDD
eukprot:m.22165 g.22165  ORF g.22165 m.22165 type:complete len:209 (-) comp13707_c0_seq1:206-832(-)